MKSIDKCSGDDCPCKTAKPVRVLKDVQIQSISITTEPSIFPGGGIQMVHVPGVRTPERQRVPYTNLS